MSFTVPFTNVEAYWHKQVLETTLERKEKEKRRNHYISCLFFEKQERDNDKGLVKLRIERKENNILMSTSVWFIFGWISSSHGCSTKKKKRKEIHFFNKRGKRRKRSFKRKRELQYTVPYSTQPIEVLFLLDPLFLEVIDPVKHQGPRPLASTSINPLELDEQTPQWSSLKLDQTLDRLCPRVQPVFSKLDWPRFKSVARGSLPKPRDGFKEKWKE